MELEQALHDIGRTLPPGFVRQKDGSLRLEAVLAERKSFLSKKKLNYICRLRVDDPARQVRFFEMLKESGFGISGGGDDDISPGFGFKKEVYKDSGKEHSGAIEEQSRLFGKGYCYAFDFSRFREALRLASEAAGFAFEIKLSEKTV